MAVMIAAAADEMACGRRLLRCGGDGGGEELSQKPIESPRAETNGDVRAS